MKHPASWKSNAARRIFYVFAFPVIFTVIACASVVIALKNALVEVAEDMWDMKCDFVSIWKNPNQ